MYADVVTTSMYSARGRKALSMSTRENLVEATKKLLWERGFAATSPRDILRESGSGQGSMYHHFSGKSDLAATALREVAVEMRASVEGILHSDKPPLERVAEYLQMPREALRGCRLGRMAAEPEIDGGVIQEPVLLYFSFLEQELASCLAEAIQEEALCEDINVHDLAIHLVAVIQGGYVLARVFQDSKQMERAVQSAFRLLSSVANDK